MEMIYWEGERGNKRKLEWERGDFMNEIMKNKKGLNNKTAYFSQYLPPLILVSLYAHVWGGGRGRVRGEFNQRGIILGISLSANYKDNLYRLFRCL